MGAEAVAPTRRKPASLPCATRGFWGFGVCGFGKSSGVRLLVRSLTPESSRRYTKTQKPQNPKVLLFDDPDSNLRLDVGVKTNRDAVHAQGFDRLMEVDLSLFDVESLRLELLRDVGRRHRTE